MKGYILGFIRPEKSFIRLVRFECAESVEFFLEFQDGIGID